MIDQNKKTKELTKARSFVSDLLKAKGIKETRSSRHGIHTRFPMSGGIEEARLLFAPYDIEVKESTTSCSSSFDTYLLDFPDGTQLFCVNNSVRSSSSPDFFKTKELCPSNFGVDGQLLSSSEVIDMIVNRMIHLDHPIDVRRCLVDMSISSLANQKCVKVDCSCLSSKDLKTISKDFGEITSAIWVLGNLGFDSVFFPPAINERLVDFYAIRNSVVQPFSVKSGRGSGTSISNLFGTIDLSSNFSDDETLVIDVMRTISERKAEDGIIEAHRIIGSDSLRTVESLIGTTVNKQLIESWIESEGLSNVSKHLEPFFKESRRKIDSDTWIKIAKQKSKSGIIVSPLGYDLSDRMNKNENIEFLTRLARKVNVTQLNVDVKSKSLIFDESTFASSKFKFHYWANALNPGNNKFGFKTF